MTVTVDKLYLQEQYKSMLIEDPIFKMALGGFLLANSNEMPAEMFGKLVGEYWLPPEKLLAEKPREHLPKKWDVRMNELDNGIQIDIYRNGEKFVFGKSYIIGDTDTDYLQAISYAAHMAYKFAQQRDIR